MQNGAKNLEAGLRIIYKLISQVFPNINYNIMIVDNSINDEFEFKLDERIALIKGDNTNREFSGLERGISWMENEYDIKPIDLVLLLNDTISADGNLEIFITPKMKKLGASLNSNEIIGQVLFFPIPMNIFGIYYDQWIRTHFFLTRHQVLQKLLPLTLPYVDEELFSEDPEVFFRDGIELSKNYQEVIKGYLTGRPNIFLSKWHSAKRLNSNNFNEFKLKAKALLCEHYLSIKAKFYGISLVNCSYKPLMIIKIESLIRMIIFKTGAFKYIARYNNRFI